RGALHLFAVGSGGPRPASACADGLKPRRSPHAATTRGRHVQPLAADASLSDLQGYVAEMERERGFTTRSLQDQTWRLMEEAGELLRAVRQNAGRRSRTGELVGSVDEELVDVLLFACSVANRLGIDLAEAIRVKEALNETRDWAGAT